MNNVPQPVLAIVAALVVAFAVTSLGRVGGWLLLALVIGLAILAAGGKLANTETYTPAY